MTKSEYNYSLRWAKKIKAIKILGGSCKNCGENRLFRLCFHHRDKNIKTFNLNQCRSYSWSIWEKEIAKCDLLCRNCHFIKHFTLNAIKKQLLKIINKNCCDRCGYDGPALDFHHVKENKKFNFGEITGNKIRIPLEVIIKEMEDCIVLCRNCHNEEHIETDKFIRLKYEIYKRVNGYKERQPAADKQTVLRMIKQGLTQTEIGKRLGYAKSTICGIVKCFNKK